MNSIASLSARSSMPRSGSYRTTSTNGSKVTTRKDRIKAAGVSARRRRKHSLTPSPLRGKKRSLPDHHQQRTGHLQKGTVCKIKYKLLQIRRATDVLHILAVEPIRQVRRDVAGAVVGEQPWPVDDLCPVEPRGLQCQVQRGGDIFDLHRRAQLPGDDVT